jgi:hypothetical protein
MGKKNNKAMQNEVIRVHILNMVYDNKFYLVDDKEKLYVNGDTKGKLLPNEAILKGIKSGEIKTEKAVKKAVKKATILIKESEFFRIVKTLNPENAERGKRGYPFLKDIVELKIGNSAKRYAPLFDNKLEPGIIYVNGKKFKRIFCNSGQNRQKKVLFVAAELYDKVFEIGMCGIDPHDPSKVKPACKWNAYLGLSCTDSTPVSAPNIVIIKDYHKKVSDTFDVVTGRINENDQYELSTKVQHNVKKEIDILPFDGCGLVDVDKAREWQNELGLDYLPASWQVRMAPATKGNLYVFDIKGFAQEYGKRKITDRWNRVWDLFDDKIDCILTESMVKFAGLYNSFSEWETAFNTDLYGYHRTFGISHYSIPYRGTQKSPKGVKDHCVISYQPLQSLQFTDDQIKSLCAPTVRAVRKAHTDIDSFIKWRNLDDEDQTDDHVPPVLMALKYNHALANDEYVRDCIKKELTNFRRINCIRIRVDGSYQTLEPDLFGLAQRSFGLEPTGLLKAREVYNKYFVDKKIKEIDLIRFPHIACEHCPAKVVDESGENWEKIKKWFKYQDTGYITSMYDTFLLRMNSADLDGDCIFGISSPEIVQTAKKQEANTILFNSDQSNENQQVQADNYLAMAKSDVVGFRNDIGTTVNNTSKLWNMITPENPNNGKIMDYIKVMSVIDSLTIDFVKTGVKAIVPKEIKRVLKDSKNPWFFQFRSYKEYGAEQTAQENIKDFDSETRSLHDNSTSNMHRISHYMFDQISKIRLKYNVPEFDWKTLLQGDYDLTNGTIYKKVKQKLLSLNSEYSKFFKEIHNGKDPSDLNSDNAERQSTYNSQFELFFADCRVELLMIQPNIDRLINDMIICYYTEKSFSHITTKNILWECFPDQMIARAKGEKQESKIYNLEELDKKYYKLVDAKKKREKLSSTRKDIPMVDNIKAKVFITDADKKFVNKQLKTRRSKKLYYAMLYIWLKINTGNEKEQLIKIGTNKKHGEIPKFRICQLAGIKTRDWPDALESLKRHNMIESNLKNPLVPKVRLNYIRQDGKEIELPNTCKGMLHWINRYVPSKTKEHYEFIFDQSTAKQPGVYQNQKPVIRLEDGKVFPSARAADRSMGFRGDDVDGVCMKRRKTSGGYHWMFLDEYEQKQDA